MPFMLSDYIAGAEGMQQLQQETEARKGLQETYKNMPAPDEVGGNPFSTQVGYLQQQIDRAGRSGNVKLWQMLNKQLDDTMGKQSQYEIRSANLAAKKNDAIGRASNAILEGMDPKTGEVSPEVMQGVVQQLSEVDPEKAKNLWINWQANGQRFTPEMQRGLKATIAQSMSSKDLSNLREKQVEFNQREQDRKEAAADRRAARLDRESNAAMTREMRREALEQRKREFEFKKEQASKKEKKIGKLSDPKEIERTSDELKSDFPKLSPSDRGRASEDIRTRQKELMRSDDSLSAQEAYGQAYDEVTSQVKDVGGTYIPVFGTVGAKTTYKGGTKPSSGNKKPSAADF